MQVTAPADLVPVRNTKSGPTVFRDPAADVTIRWEGAGDPGGQDWQYVPETYRNHPQFAVMLRKGVLKIETPEAGVAHVDGISAPSASESLEAQAAAAFHRPEINDFLVRTCVGPGSREGVLCGTQVSIRQSDLASTPPLCDNHKPLTGSYVPVQGTGPDGLPSLVWVAVQVAPATTEAAQTGPATIAPGV